MPGGLHSTCRRVLRSAALVLGLELMHGGAAFAAETVRVSVDDNGLQGDAASSRPELNANGRFVAFVSTAGNLVPGDANGVEDVFVHDRETKTVQRVSVSGLGVEGNGPSGLVGSGGCPRAEISADGRWVVFVSLADNLVGGDTNETADVFVFDRQMGQLERVSLDAANGQIEGDSATPAISADGRFVAFVALAAAVPEDGNDELDVFVRDWMAGTTERVSVGSGGSESNADSHCPSLSNDGRFVAFHSTATNLVPGDANGIADVFVHDRLGHTTERVSVSSAGVEADGDGSLPRISGDGRMVAFQSEATNLVAGDSNGVIDIFVHDRQTGVTTRASTAVTGAQATGISGFQPDVDDAGRYVVFQSSATDLVPDDTNGVADVFVKDLLTGMIRRVSLAHDGSQMQAPVGVMAKAISGNGRIAAFDSEAGNLVAGDTNEVDDVFVRDLPTFPYEYAAKVVCGTQSNPASLSLTPGVYATTVNVHSPTGGVEFFKKLALSHPPREQRPGEIFPIAQHVLQYDQAIAVDCDDLLREVFGGAFPDSYVEGFLVIQSTGSLDVTAVYSTAALDAQGRAGDHSSIDVEPVAERRKSPQLSVTKSGRYFCNAVPIERECTVVAALYTVVVRNDGAVPAEEVVLTDAVSRSDGLPVVFVLPAPHEEPAGAVFAVTGPRSIQVEIAELAPGEEAQVRFWALAVISPGYQPDVLINRAEVAAENVEGTATAVTQQGFD